MSKSLTKASVSNDRMYQCASPLGSRPGYDLIAYVEVHHDLLPDLKLGHDTDDDGQE